MPEYYIVSGELGGEDYTCPVESADSDMRLAFQIWRYWKADTFRLDEYSPGWIVEAVLTAEQIIQKYEAEQISQVKGR